MAPMAEPLTPIPSPKLSLPKGEICILSAIDTTCQLTVPAVTLVEPVIPGHELMNFPTFSFLITHKPTNRQVLFDLGCRRDFWNLPNPIAKVIDEKVPGIRVDKDVSEILMDNGVDLANVEAGVVSHHHYDHMGDPALFPKTMELLVGPGFVRNFMPGYPVNENSPVWESAFEGRSVKEVEFNCEIVGYPAQDYFSDGSFFILNSPGHAIGHLSALVRTGDDEFVFLGGDICHFGGSFRPTVYNPMPSTLTPHEAGLEQKWEKDTTCPCSLFTKCHPAEKEELARTTPYYKPCSAEDTWYVDPPRASESIEKLKALDADERVLIVIAHDPAVLGVGVPLFPTGFLNGWKGKGLKEKVRWRFLGELPWVGRGRQEFLVDGTYFEGKRVKDLDGKTC